MSDNSQLDLGKLLSAVATNLLANQTDLNQADTINHDHGNNIVEVFKIASKAVKANKAAPIAEQLANASSALAQNTTSGSGQYYAQSFNQAASQMRGQELNPESILTLITSLLGSSPAIAKTSQPTDMLGGLLGSLMGGGTVSPQQAPQNQTGDILSDLVGGFMGGKPGGTNPQGLDTGDLINAGLAYMQAKGRGEGNLQAIISGIISASPLGNSPARSQSAQIIAGTLLQKVKASAAK